MSVTPELVHGLAQHVRGGAGEIRATLDQLESQVGTLRASWSGEAQEAYSIAQDRWSKALGEMQTLLTRVAATADEMASTYTTTDRRLAGGFGA